MPWGSRGGGPCQVQPGGGVPWGVPWQGVPGGTPAGGTRGGYPGGGYPAGAGGTQLGQHREYLLHGRRYASCVHAGGLSCLFLFLAIFNARFYCFYCFGDGGPCEVTWIFDNSCKYNYEGG